MKSKKPLHSLLLVAFVVALSAAGCSPRLRGGKKPPGTSGSSFADFFEHNSGGAIAASSPSFKLKSVSLGSVANTEATSATYKKKDAISGSLQKSQ